MDNPRSRAVAIINPATRGNVRRIVELLELAVPAQTQLEVFVTESQGHARELAEANAASADVLIAVGGDGTVAEVVGAARNEHVDVGIVPGGSTNIVARELRIPTNPYLAIQLIFGSHMVRALDAGLCNGRAFVHMAGAGVDSALFDLADPALKRRVGWMAYLPAALAALRRPLSAFTIDAEEMHLEGVRSPLVLVANGPAIIAPQFMIDRRISPDDGWLDVLVVTATTPAQLARVMARLAMRQMGESPFVTTFRTRAVSVVADPPIPVQLDGDVVCPTPVHFTIDPGSVRFRVPSSS